MKDDIQSYIYTEKYLSQLYRMAAAYSPREDERDVLLNFARSATDNANYLNYFYKMEYGVNYDPMIPEIVIQGGFRDILDEIVRVEVRSFLNYRKHTYYQDNIDFLETMRAIADDTLAKIVTLLAILTDINNQS